MIEATARQRHVEYSGSRRRGSRLHLSCLPVGQVVDRRGMGAKEVLGWDGTECLEKRGWVRKRPGFEWAGMLARDGSGGCVRVYGK